MANDSLSQRIFIAGGPGSGKTTLARRLSSALGLIHDELDRVFLALVCEREGPHG